MAAPSYLTWIGNVATGINPYRPSVNDFGGSDKQNDLAYPPGPNEPAAEEWNQLVGQASSLAAVAPAAKIHVIFTSGTPSVYAVYSANPSLLISDITVTDVGVGIVTLAIPASKLPDLRWGAAFPQVTGNQSGVGFRSAAQTLRCEIRTAGTLADVNFIAEWG